MPTIDKTRLGEAVTAAEDYYYAHAPFSGPDELREGLKQCLLAALPKLLGPKIGNVAGMRSVNGFRYVDVAPVEAGSDVAVGTHVYAPTLGDHR